MKQEGLYKRLPNSPGVYLMRAAKGELLYVGKAVNLRRRVSSYFLRPHDTRIEKLVSQIKKIGHRQTDTAIEALILEAELIKKHQPPFNIREKDDTSFLYVEFTKESFPRVLLVRGKDMEGRRLAPSPIRHPQARSARKRDERSVEFGAGFGPFTSAKSIREALRILRKIFPYASHPADNANATNSVRMPQKKIHSQHSHVFADSHRDRRSRPCFDYQIGLCPGTCIGAISKRDYAKNIRNLKLFFHGKKARIIQSLKREMKLASKHLEFEKAAKLRGQLFALKHIQDVAVITDDSEQITNNSGYGSKVISYKSVRIEGYDISNISGTSAVGSMVVFAGGEPDKNEYRKFKIRSIRGSDDVGMMKEVLRRRFRNRWALPNLILVDGGVPQVHAARDVLREVRLKIPVVGIAKGPERKRNDVIGTIPEGVQEKTLIQVRDEAHRFAIAYHKKLRAVRTLQ